MLSNVSFGNIVKVNAPISTSKNIISMSKTNTTIGSKLSEVLYGDNPEKKSYVFSFPDKRDEYYIFTGDEAKKYIDSYRLAWARVEYAQEKHDKTRKTQKNNEMADIAVKSAWDTHRNYIKQLIQLSSHKIAELTPIYSSDNEQIKSIDIVV